MLTTGGSFHLVKEEKLDFHQTIRSNTCWRGTCCSPAKKNWSLRTNHHCVWCERCRRGLVPQSLLCYRRYHSAAKPACFVCGGDWAHSNQKMTARYVRENGFHRVAVLWGTPRQHCQYYKAPSESLLVWNVQCMNKRPIDRESAADSSVAYMFHRVPPRKW